MKITKLKTKLGTFGSPVSTELSNMVERMRSEDIKDAADRLRTIALQSRLAIGQGTPRYYLKDADQLPYLLFSATFGKAGLDSPNTFTSLLMLNIPCPDGHRQVEEIKRRVSQVPYTVLAFEGSSDAQGRRALRIPGRCNSLDIRPGEQAYTQHRELCHLPRRSSSDSRTHLHSPRHVRPDGGKAIAHPRLPHEL